MDPYTTALGQRGDSLRRHYFAGVMPRAVQLIQRRNFYLQHFYGPPAMLNSRSGATAHASSLADQGVVMPEDFVMAIEDYVRSIAVKDTVSKDQVFRYLEMQFARADRNHDGQLDIDELRSFVGAISLPETDQR